LTANYKLQTQNYLFWVMVAGNLLRVSAHHQVSAMQQRPATELPATTPQNR